MIKFFRKIRQQLLSENKFSKYLIYAVGEIVLVVLGILIALAINNHNERTKSKEKVIQLLQQVHKELAVNLELATPAIDLYSRKDSLITLIMTNKVTEEMYHNNFEIRSIVTNYLTYVPKTNAFDRLMDNSIEIPTKYDSLIDMLKNLYVNDLELVVTYNNKMSKEVDDFQTVLKRTKPWYSEWIHSLEISPEATKMMMTDPFYRNQVANYWNLGLENHYLGIKSFSFDAYAAYLEITDDLDLEDTISKNLANSFDQKENVGVYVFKSDTIRISTIDQKIQLQRNGNPIENVIPFSNSGFCSENNAGFYRFVKDSKSNIKGVTIRLGFYDEKFNKE